MQRADTDLSTTVRIIVQRGLRRLCAPAEMEEETVSPMPPPWWFRDVEFAPVNGYLSARRGGSFSVRTQPFLPHCRCAAADAPRLDRRNGGPLLISRRRVNYSFNLPFRNGLRPALPVSGSGSELSIPPGSALLAPR
jgi:hypothetical protein